MNKDLSSYRKSYTKKTLEEANLPKSPYALFSDWFNEVEQFDGVEEANAMTITTIGSDGFPKARVVLLKKYDENGFVFYTNYTSEKGKAIAENNKVCISFFWPNLERQVIIKGVAEKISAKDSNAYFTSRPIGSQLGALASNQSEIIASRDILENKLNELKETYKSESIPKPEYWGGYCIKPISFEFWQGRANRLHDRMHYSKSNNNWEMNRLAP